MFMMKFYILTSHVTARQISDQFSKALYIYTHTHTHTYILDNPIHEIKHQWCVLRSSRRFTFLAITGLNSSHKNLHVVQHIASITITRYVYFIYVMHVLKHNILFNYVPPNELVNLHQCRLTYTLNSLWEKCAKWLSQGLGTMAQLWCPTTIFRCWEGKIAKQATIYHS
jgi:hypothetical protein